MVNGRDQGEIGVATPQEDQIWVQPPIQRESRGGGLFLDRTEITQFRLSTLIISSPERVWREGGQ